MTRHLLLAADPASTIIGSSHEVTRDYGEPLPRSATGIRPTGSWSRRPAGA